MENPTSENIWYSISFADSVREITKKEFLDLKRYCEEEKENINFEELKQLEQMRRGLLPWIDAYCDKVIKILRDAEREYLRKRSFNSY